MATTPKQQTPADPPAPPTPTPAPAEGLEGRVSGLEDEQRRQGGLLEQILTRLPGGGPPASPQQTGQGPAPAPGGKSVAEQVREGIAALRAEEEAAAEGEANKTARTDHAARIKALEERVPAETAANPAGVLRARAQRILFGITESSR